MYKVQGAAPHTHRCPQLVTAPPWTQRMRYTILLTARTFTPAKRTIGLPIDILPLAAYVLADLGVIGFPIVCCFDPVSSKPTALPDFIQNASLGSRPGHASIDFTTYQYNPRATGLAPACCRSVSSCPRTCLSAPLLPFLLQNPRCPVGSPQASPGQ